MAKQSSLTNPTHTFQSTMSMVDAAVHPPGPEPAPEPVAFNSIDEVLNEREAFYKKHQNHVSSQPYSPRRMPDSSSSNESLHPYARTKTQQVIHCHDLMGGYTFDIAARDHESLRSYPFFYWQYIDIFIYFSHRRLSIPPKSWTDSAHKNGVLSLATLLFEWKEGAIDCRRFLDAYIQDQDKVVQAFIDVAKYFNFDGYFFNFECKVDVEQLPVLKTLLSTLHKALHEAIPHALVIWYDSVSVKTGELVWQSKLNEHNRPFFENSDALFLDYHWKKNDPFDSFAALSTEEVNASRNYDIFTGIDIWGRGSLGGGGWNTPAALNVLREAKTSTALFAPAWTFEKLTEMLSSRDDFNGMSRESQDLWIHQYWLAAEHRLWIGFDTDIDLSFPGADPPPPSTSDNLSSIHDFVAPRRFSFISSLPFQHSFNMGAGSSHYERGLKVSDKQWTNLSSQDVQTVVANSVRTGSKTSHTFSSPVSNKVNTLLAKSLLTYQFAFEGGSSVYISMRFLEDARPNDDNASPISDTNSMSLFEPLSITVEAVSKSILVSCLLFNFSKDGRSPLNGRVACKLDVASNYSRDSNLLLQCYDDSIISIPLHSSHQSSMQTLEIDDNHFFDRNIPLTSNSTVSHLHLAWHRLEGISSLLSNCIVKSVTIQLVVKSNELTIPLHSFIGKIQVDLVN